MSDRVALQRLAAAVSDLQSGFQAIASAADHDPLPGSVAADGSSDAALRHQGWLSHSPNRDACRTSLLIFKSAEDHLLALADLLHPAGRPFACSTAARGAAEAAARSAYLADPTVDARERCRRLANERLFSLSEDKRFFAAGRHADGTAVCDDRIAALASAARAHGFTVKRSKSGGARYLDHERPSTMALLSRLTDTDPEKPAASLFYRLASATTHATFSGVLRSVERIPASEHALQDETLVLGNLQLTPAAAAIRLAIAPLAFAQAGYAMCAVFGWPTVGWRGTVDSALATWHDEMQRAGR